MQKLAVHTVGGVIKAGEPLTLVYFTRGRADGSGKVCRAWLVPVETYRLTITADEQPQGRDCSYPVNWVLKRGLKLTAPRPLPWRPRSFPNEAFVNNAKLRELMAGNRQRNQRLGTKNPSKNGLER